MAKKALNCWQHPSVTHPARSIFQRAEGRLDATRRLLEAAQLPPSSPAGASDTPHLLPEPLFFYFFFPDPPYNRKQGVFCTGITRKEALVAAGVGRSSPRQAEPFPRDQAFLGKRPSPAAAEPPLQLGTKQVRPPEAPSSGADSAATRHCLWTARGEHLLGSQSSADVTWGGSLLWLTAALLAPNPRRGDTTLGEKKIPNSQTWSCQQAPTGS